MRITDPIGAAVGIFAAAILYVPLTLIPVAGPIAGRMISRTGFGGGFLPGMTAGIIGSVILAILIMPAGGFDILNPGFLVIGWMFVAWNLAGSLLAGLGWSLASLGAASGYDNARRTRKGRTNRGRANHEGTAANEHVQTFVICRNCNGANPEEAATCRFCGSALDDIDRQAEGI